MCCGLPTCWAYILACYNLMVDGFCLDIKYTFPLAIKHYGTLRKCTNQIIYGIVELRNILEHCSAGCINNRRDAL